jgi:hypothetical protein
MAIPEAQLDTWAKQGATQTSKDTYATIKGVIDDGNSPYAIHSPVSFLQGSYGNDTNVYGVDSDVDVVLQFNGAFQYDLSGISEQSQKKFHTAFGNTGYGYQDFKKEVTTWLIANFGKAVEPGTKAIRILAASNRRDADVLPAIGFRRYHKFEDFNNQNYTEGICFYTADGTKIINYPKLHSTNCTAKHQATSLWFKPTVRILKNIRNRMISDGTLEDGIAPSYYLEGLLYNVPNDRFGKSYDDTVVNAINWIMKADKSTFVCANEQYKLLWEGSPVTWRTEKCEKFLNGIIKLWKDW